MKRYDMMFKSFLLVVATGTVVGCVGLSGGKDLVAQIYPVVASEAEWIRNGEPIEFEGEMWYPRDDVDVMTDAEVFLLGDYKGAQFFVSKEDVKPYNRLYTKFARNQYRIYQKRAHD